LDLVEKGRRVSWASLVILVVLTAAFAGWSASTSRSGRVVSSAPSHGPLRSALISTKSSTVTVPVPSMPEPPPPPTLAPGTTPALGDNGLGVAYFGSSEDETVKALSAYFGSPTGQPASGCDQQWTEVAWNDLIVEFLDHIFIGYRYLVGASEYTQTTDLPAGVISPTLETITGIDLTSTLGQLERTYPDVQQTGSFQWTSPDGIHFVVDSDQTTTYPPPPSSTISEIKIGTCGDF
jgi:hypothetical protein